MHEASFRCTVTDEQRRLMQWHLEEYLLCPWGEFRHRAQQAETVEAMGSESFDCSLKAGAVPGGQGCRLVEKEQRGVSPGRHDGSASLSKRQPQEGVTRS